MTCILFAANETSWREFEAPLRAALREAGADADLVTEAEPEAVDYIIYAPNSALQDFAPYTNTRAVLSLWAGVEKIVDNPTLTQPLCRMVDDGLRQGMVEFVCGHVLRHHLGIDGYLARQDGRWRHDVPPLARCRKVTVLGIGELGMACAQALARLGFDVSGWSRSLHEAEGLRSFAGDEGLAKALVGAEIVVLLLPLTDQTENLINAERLALLAPGAVVVNPGRGPLIDDEALLDALVSGQVSHATLDVFRVEPLPPEHPFWAHPNITVTPHIASATRPETAARVIAENVRRGEAGAPLLHVVDRSAGY